MTGGRNADRHLEVTVTLVDGNGVPVAGASVSATISGPKAGGATNTQAHRRESYPNGSTPPLVARLPALMIPCKYVHHHRGHFRMTSAFGSLPALGSECFLLMRRAALRNIRVKATPARNGVGRATAICLLATQWVLACSSASPPAELLAPTPEPELELKRGDILRIYVWRQPEFSGDFVIGADSTLVHPLYQEVSVAGLTLPAARERLSEFLRTYLQGAQLVIAPLSSITVAGEVRQPNVYHFAWGTTIAEAIGHAGGPTPTARMDKIRLVRDGSLYEVSLTEELFTYGSVEVVSGDQIFVVQGSTFNIWKDVIAPATAVAFLVFTVLRIEEITKN